MKKLTSDKLIDIICQIHSNCTKQWPLHEPYFANAEKQKINACLASGYVSSVGKSVVEFEQAIQRFIGVSHAIATVNGTAALHVSYLLAGIKPNDEVLTSPLSFIATSNAIRYCQACPHFVEVESDSLGIDPEKLRLYLLKQCRFEKGVTVNKQTGRIIRALVVTHILGHPCQVQALKSICDAFNLLLIEDAAEALGSTLQDQHVGTFGKLGILSFNGNKIITCGAGGMILTNDENLAQRARHLTTTAKVSHPWEYYHDEVGYNYRMPNLNAALGLAQLERLPLILSYKRQLSSLYEAEFAHFSDIMCVTEAAECHSNYWLNAIVVKDRSNLNEFLLATNQNGIETRPLWQPHHTLPMFFDCPRMPIIVAQNLYERILCLPSSIHTFKFKAVNKTCAG